MSAFCENCPLNGVQKPFGKDYGLIFRAQQRLSAFKSEIAEISATDQMYREYIVSSAIATNLLMKADADEMEKVAFNYQNDTETAQAYRVCRAMIMNLTCAHIIDSFNKSP